MLKAKPYIISLIRFKMSLDMEIRFDLVDNKDEKVRYLNLWPQQGTTEQTERAPALSPSQIE
jgi:hypothetical protein